MGVLLCALGSCLVPRAAHAQATVTATILRQPTPSTKPKRPLPSSVLWLTPLQPTPVAAAETSHPPYTLVQKDRMFTPHVLVVPVGSPVSFPNADPFFHNVFSLYNGKRFDLGLYEKGTNRQVILNHEGVSYIFCNIHPEMSAVVLALKTPWWARADPTGGLRIDGLPPGDYEAHLWVEGVDTAVLDHWTHRLHVANGTQSAGNLTVDPDALHPGHANKFGQPYRPDARTY